MLSHNANTVLKLSTLTLLLSVCVCVSSFSYHVELHQISVYFQFHFVPPLSSLFAHYVFYTSFCTIKSVCVVG